MKSMRAAQMIGMGEVICVEAPVRPPEDGELLVKTTMASICGSDLHILTMGVFAMPPAFPQKPGFPGHEGVGHVVESRHPQFAVGDVVLTAPMPPKSFTFAEYQTIDAAFCLKLEAGRAPLPHLLMAQQLGTVIYAMRRYPRDLVGKTVVVLGQGSAGLFFAYLAKRAGAAQVIVSDLSEARLAASKAFGADLALQANRQDLRQAVLEASDGQGADFLIEAVGRQETLLQTTSLMREDGSMLLFGLPDTNEPVHISFQEFFRKKLTAYSTYGCQFEDNLASFRLAAELIASGQIDVSPLLSHHFPIEKVAEAIALADSRQDNALKVSLTFDP